MGAPRRRGRPAGAQTGADNSAVIVDAARELLAQNGFEKTTMRAVAARAGVDPALIHHYFQNKDRLVWEALRPDLDPVEIFAGLHDAPSVGTEFLRRALRVWESDTARLERGVAVIRVAMTRDDIAEALRTFQFGMVESALGSLIPPDDRDRRIALIVSQMLGLMVMRYVLSQPDITSASIDELAADLGPVIDLLVAGR